VTNAVIHGRLTSEQRIRVAVLVTNGRVGVRVSHAGETFDPRETVMPVWEADSPARGGWGLRIVEAVTRAWGVEPDDQRTIVWFEV
jgi:anti-sigma regulatory factor (Ser/Thr protein kinase)